MNKIKIIKYILIISIYFPYWISKFLLTIISLLRFGFYEKDRQTRLCIEAGIKGWESIEFKEYYQSAVEYLNESQVYKLELSSNENYYKKIKDHIISHQITHYFYDPRTGSQSLLRAIFESTRIAIVLSWYGVVPIALATDLSVRRWRYQVSIVTAVKGIVVCFMSVKKIHSMFPHERIIGPSLMPFSIKTKKTIETLINNKKINIIPKVIFSGSLYEPRTTILNKIQNGLKERGIKFEILGRNVGGPRVSDLDYWERFVNADIVLTTSDQMIQSGTDLTEVPHLIYRYLEVLTCGSILVAQDVPAIRRFFIPGQDFIPFDSSQSAINEITKVFENRDRYNTLSKSGNKKACSLIDAKVFWILIDAKLGRHSLY